MTMPNERLNSLKMTKEFLRDLLDPRKSPKVPKFIRRQAYYCLKHFPESYYIDSYNNLTKMVIGGLMQQNMSGTPIAMTSSQVVKVLKRTVASLFKYDNPKAVKSKQSSK